MVKQQLKNMVQHPIYMVVALVIPLISAVLVAYIQFYLPAKVEAAHSLEDRATIELREIIVNSEFAVAEAQAKLNAYLGLERQDIKSLFQQLVNTYGTEAWVKYLDYEDQSFKLLVINKEYTRKYGIYIAPYGMTDSEMYVERDLSELQQAALLEYALNDRKSIIAGNGHCVMFEEIIFPLSRPSGYVDKFRKCMLTHGTQTYVFGTLSR